MSNEKKMDTAAEHPDVLSVDAEAAAELEREAKAELDISTYTHKFKNPFTVQGITVDALTFNWGALTGKDHMDIENEMLMRGKTLVVPEFTSDFLCGMAVRACTVRDKDGICILSTKAMREMPIRDFQLICKKARSFLQHAGS